jgi:glycosyltransferase involved in cell wall biosynthesis
MHIGFLINEYPHPNLPKTGGIGTSCAILAKHLVALGVQVSVFGWSPEAIDINDNGVNLKFIQPAKGIISAKKNAKRMERLIEDSKVDVIEVPDWCGYAALMKFKIPCVVRLHGSDSYFCVLESRKAKLKNYFLERANLKKANFIISVGAFVLKETNKLFGISRPNEVVYNGVELTNRQPEAIKSDEQRILYFGTIVRKKGLLLMPPIIEMVLAENPNVKFVFAGNDAKDWKTGSGSTLALMQEGIKPAYLESVTYLGSLNQKDLFQEIERATLCVFPSQAEAFPMAWLEAMAKGKAIVGSNEPWAEEIIDHKENGFLLDPKTPEKFAAGILELLNNEELRMLLGMKAFEKVKDFDIKNTVEQNINIYKNLLS